MKYWILWMALVCLLPCRLWAQQPVSPSASVDAMVRTIQLEKNAQKAGTAWEKEQLALMDEIRQLKLEQAWVHSQARTFARYTEKAEQRVNELKRDRKEIQNIERQLEGRLIEYADRLSGFIEGDLPFLAAERSSRRAFLENTVADYSLAPSEKLRRLLEGFQAELGYGREVTLTRETREIGGSHKHVRCLRLGRMGLYALLFDGSKAWMWQTEDGFIPMSAQSTASLSAACDMVENGRVYRLPLLPFKEAVHGTEQ